MNKSIENKLLRKVNFFSFYASIVNKFIIIPNCY